MAGNRGYDTRRHWSFPQNVIADLWSNGEWALSKVRRQHVGAGITFDQHYELLQHNFDTVMSEMTRVSERDKEIFYKYYRDLKTHRTLAEEYHISSARVGQILERVRHFLRNETRYSRLIYTDKEFEEWKEWAFRNHLVKDDTQ